MKHWIAKGIYILDGEKTIARLHLHSDDLKETFEAYSNAQIMAAAPELFDVCVATRVALEDLWGDEAKQLPVYQRLNAVIGRILGDI